MDGVGRVASGTKTEQLSRATLDTKAKLVPLPLTPYPLASYLGNDAQERPLSLRSGAQE